MRRAVELLREAWFTLSFSATALFLHAHTVGFCLGTGQSMRPTMEHNSVIAVDKLTLRFRRPRRGDVVLLRPLHGGEFCLCKRVRYLAGEEVPGRGPVPEGHVWVEGDNAELSSDSRHFGPVPEHLIVGLSRAMLYPRFNPHN